MKFLIFLSVFTFSLAAVAQEDLNTMKTQANSHIDQKMTTLQSAKSCVNKATTMDKFKACKYDMHEEMKMQKMEMMDEKKKESKD
jgi:hypothetical protein